MTAVPTPIREAFAGIDPEGRSGVSALLSTVDEEGWPHLSFLSAGEVLIDGDRLALTLWGKARSLAALERAGRGVLFAAAEGAVWEIRLGVDAIERNAERPTAIVLARLGEVREHRAPYAEVERLIGFRLSDPDGTIARWNSQVMAMRAALEGKLP